MVTGTIFTKYLGMKKLLPKFVAIVFLMNISLLELNSQHSHRTLLRNGYLLNIMG